LARWDRTVKIIVAIQKDNELLRNASVLVSLFRALYLTRPGDHRNSVARQLVSLLREFVDFETGAVLLAPDEDQLAAQFDDPALYQKLAVDGPVYSERITAVPLYANRALTGALLLQGAPLHQEEIFSALASLASVALESARESERLRQQCAALEQRLIGNGGILGESPAIRKLLERIEKVAPRDTTVLIHGESGTGKELTARLIHAGSRRAGGPFIAINCAAIAESLLESELLGHEKGAFTGAGGLKKGKIELAEGGTLFLDEVGELAPALQAKLLRVLQEREFERLGGTRSIQVDIRVVAATNRDLGEHVRQGQFRQDLFHRLNVVALRTPPLRERKEDIARLAAHFLERFAGQGMRLSPETLRCLEAYEWPGNVRELQNAIEHAVVLGDGPVVLPSDLPESLWGMAPTADLGEFQSSVQDAKRDSIVRAYRNADGDYKAAARLLGLHPNYLLRLVRNLGLKEAVRK